MRWVRCVQMLADLLGAVSSATPEIGLARNITAALRYYDSVAVIVVAVLGMRRGSGLVFRAGVASLRAS